jgi:hypothetical protein
MFHKGEVTSVSMSAFLNTSNNSAYVNKASSALILQIITEKS